MEAVPNYTYYGVSNWIKLQISYCALEIMSALYMKSPPKSP